MSLSWIAVIDFQNTKPPTHDPWPVGVKRCDPWIFKNVSWSGYETERTVELLDSPSETNMYGWQGEVSESRYQHWNCKYL